MVLVVDARPAGGRAPRGRPRAAARARARPTCAGCCSREPWRERLAPPERARRGARVRDRAARRGAPPGPPAARGRRSRGAGAGWCRPATPWSTPPSPRCSVTIALVGLAHRLPRAAVDGRRRGRARARPGRSATSRGCSLAGRDDAGRPRRPSTSCSAARSRCAPTSSAGCCPPGRPSSTSPPGRCSAGSGWLTLLPPGRRARTGARAALAGRAARRRGHPRRRPALGIGAADGRRAAGAARRLDRARHPRSRPRSWCRASGSPSCSSAGWCVRAHRSRPPVQNGVGQHGPPRDRRRAHRARRRWPGCSPGRSCPAPTPTTGARWCAPRSCRPSTSRSSRARCPVSGATPSPTPRRSTTRSCSRWPGCPPDRSCASPPSTPTTALVWGAADRSTDGVPFQQVGSRIAPARRRHPGRRHGRRRRRRVRRLLAADRRRPHPHRVRRAARRGARLRAVAQPRHRHRGRPRRLLGGERYTMSALLPPTPASELPEDLDVASGASLAAGPRPARRPPRLLDQPGRWRVGQAAGRRRPDAHRGHLHRRRHPEQLREGLPPGPRERPG